MKATGMVRKLDDLGRVVLPKELRTVLGLGNGDPLEIFTQDQTVLLRKYEPLCVFCGNGGPMVLHHGKRICKTCQAALGNPVDFAPKA